MIVSKACDNIHHINIQVQHNNDDDDDDEANRRRPVGPPCRLNKTN